MTTSSPPDFASAWRDSWEEWARAWAGLVQPAAEGEKPPPTPAEAWKRSMDRWLGAWSTFLEDMSTTPAFAAASGRALNTMLDVQKPLRDTTEATMQRWLEAINMPTRADIVRLARQLNEVTARLDEMGDRMDELQDSLTELGEGRRRGKRSDDD